MLRAEPAPVEALVKGIRFPYHESLTGVCRVLPTRWRDPETRAVANDG